jgi:hypothetical protein
MTGYKQHVDLAVAALSKGSADIQVEIAWALTAIAHAQLATAAAIQEANNRAAQEQEVRRITRRYGGPV